jgi:1-deoxy-D-xylulose-5-phosphate synthase
LSRLRGPADIRGFGPAERAELAREIRDRICRVVSSNGGHFGSNLGVVELTIALHTVFDFSVDKLVWDVSHQCYPHKLLTGRYDRFPTLRQYGGISGFCHKAESHFDTAFAGHAGTATSIALGIARGAELLGTHRRSVAVVGDASIASGMTLEALNHAGWLKTRLLVVLNDNEMAISHPVGALHHYLNKIRMAPLYSEIKKDVERIIDRIPVVGRRVHEGVHHLLEGVKAGLIPGRFFEDLGLKYYGPIDGHDQEALVAALEDVKDADRPVLLHVLTKKGAGWAPALEDPVKWHAAKGFLPEDREKEAGGAGGTESPRAGSRASPAPEPARPRWTAAFADALIAIAKEDPKVVAITAAMPDGTGLDKFAKAFPERTFDVGICEQHGTGFASGLRLAGLKPVFAVYSTFLQRGYDQLVHDVAIQNNPVVFAMDRGGLVGDDGVTHQGLYDIAYQRCIPGLVCLAPKDGPELAAMLRWAIASERIVAIRYPRNTIPRDLDQGRCAPIDLGKGERLRGGTGEVAFFAYGALVENALAASDMLRREETIASVYNARFAKPVDAALLEEALENHEVVFTVEDHARMGGFGSACAEAILDRRPDLAPKLRILGVADVFVDHGERSLQLRDHGLDAENLARSARHELAAEARSVAKGS